MDSQFDTLFAKTAQQGPVEPRIRVVRWEGSRERAEDKERGGIGGDRGGGERKERVQGARVDVPMGRGR